MANFLRKTSEAIGKAIPNEFSKLNSFLKFIPYVGQVSQGISSVDSAATAYGDTGSIGTGIQAGAKGYFGSIDPGQYGSGYMRTGQVTPKKDIFNTFGGIGNLFNGQTNGDIGNFDFNLPQLSSQQEPSQSDLMLKQIRSLYAQYLFSQNQAALTPQTNSQGTFTINPNLYPM